MIALRVGGLAVRIDSPPAVEGALRDRFGRFLIDVTSDAVTLEIAAHDTFRADFRLEEPAAQLALARDGEAIALAGAGARGGYWPARRAGWLDGATHLGEVDALVRLTLSLELPRRGALLVHGAALDGARGAELILGAPGAGKSTAAAAIGALSDELTVIHVERGEAEGTPYWHGRPERAPIASLRILERGGAAQARLGGSAALRGIAPHLVRYVEVAETERAILDLAAALCARLPVERLRCPEGPAYLPFLRRALGGEAAA